ncbi:MAG: D-alanine--D-alanine ligase, partial [Paracoccaceae bacterium]|nr:D-alanine--D-alanine ligase [Paracoccaceae bacterium]
MASIANKAKLRVAVVMGGLSAERDVSLSTGRECALALR